MLNFGIYDLRSVGEWGIPTFEGVKDLPQISQWLNFRQKRTGDPESTGIHFFIDDYRFENAWNQPERHVETLRRIALTITTKTQKEFGDKWTKGGISVTAAFKRAAGTVPNQTTAQLRKLVWKYRNMD